MEREDFNSNVEWVVYKVTGKLPNSPKTNELEMFQLPKGERVNGLKYYYNKSNGRYAVHLNNTYICACAKDDITNVQKDFDNTFNGDNLNDVSLMLRKKYNLNMRNQTYKEANLSFEKRGGRLSARITHNRKSHTICSCYPEQREEVRNKFNELRETRDLESIKRIMKKQYNIRGRKPKKILQDDGIISLCENGTIYKDGKLCKVDPKLYEYIDKFIGE